MRESFAPTTLFVRIRIASQFEHATLLCAYGLLRFRSRNPTVIRKSIRSFFAYLFSSLPFGLQSHIMPCASTALCDLESLYARKISGQKLHRYYLLLPLCRVLIKFNYYYVQRTCPPIPSLIFPFTFAFISCGCKVEILSEPLIMYLKCCSLNTYFLSLIL